MNNSNASPGGLYIHIPFCMSKCRYCNFYSETKLRHLDEYVSAVCQEMTMAHDDLSSPDTIYFGGGTPSLLPGHQLIRIIEQIDRIWRLDDCTEITLECNPATIDYPALEQLRRIGVNRLNIGIQSFNADNLKFLGRIHTPFQAVSIFDAARKAGFTNIGIDMIYGLPHQSITKWENDLNKAVDLYPEHISCYILTYEPGTPLQQDLTAGRFPGLGDVDIAEMFRLTHAMLNSAGFSHYEISNFSKSGFRSIHNEKYWNFNRYLGIGPGAHSYSPHTHERWWNVDSIDHYLESIHAGKRPICAHENLTKEQRLIEAVLLGLRQSKGLDLQSVSLQFGNDYATILKTGLHPWIKSGHAIDCDRRCSLTVEGMLLSDRIIGDIISLI